MGIFRLPWALAGTLLALSCLDKVMAGSSINVALKTSFSSAPYLVELLETAADENATCYFALLDRIADGYFQHAKNDQELYERFLKILKDDGHFSDPSIFSSYKLALSLHTAAPRIEAHYQYYHAAVEPAITKEDEISCPSWVHFGDAQYCSPELDRPHGVVKEDVSAEELPFDRVIGGSTLPKSILYTDITSPTFGAFHRTLVGTAREGKTSYRVRHRRSLSSSSLPLTISGYGVELALKRTDYIVIDDRDKDTQAESHDGVDEVALEAKEVADLKPLSKSQLASLGLKASTFVMQSKNPFDALLRLTQDFPKFSSSIANTNTSADFLKEHNANRAMLVPAGLNVLWINGQQITERQIDAFSLLDFMRQERQLIAGVQEIGLSAPEAVELLAHEAITAAQSSDEAERYDWTDRPENENAIVWLNSIEHDKRYEGWPTALRALLQRTYPGQLPPVKRDIFNIIVPIDLTSSDDVRIAVEQLRGFVQRKLPLRFGLVPIAETGAAVEQAMVVYYLQETYGLAVALAYLETSLDAKKLETASKALLEATVKDKRIRKEKESIDYEDILISDMYKSRVEASQMWCDRLAVTSKAPLIFMNGAAIPRTETWLQAFGTRLNIDLQTLQQAVFEERIEETAWVPDFFLMKAMQRRNSLITLENRADLKMHNVNKLYQEHAELLHLLPRVQSADTAAKKDWIHMLVVADLSTQVGQHHMNTAITLRDEHPAIELVVVDSSAPKRQSKLFAHLKRRNFASFATTEDMVVLLGELEAKQRTEEAEVDKKEAEEYASRIAALLADLGLADGHEALLLNGRVIGPIPDSSPFQLEDFEQLLKYERENRILPVWSAAEELGLAEKLSSPATLAKLSSVVAISAVSTTPEGIYEHGSSLRISKFNEWLSQQTVIEVGDATTAAVQITVTLDPASEAAQRWLPILKVLSELAGVHLKLFLNPKDSLVELPVKRFYRYVLKSQPTFDVHGKLEEHSAVFSGVPQEALLNLGMDVPAQWLVAPKVSIHDLDNIKLSNVKSDIDAEYELEHILIEGHSRETQGGSAPRGAQLVLSTTREPHFADTIIMANLGYFQFKANPGYYNIALQEGRSDEIFSIDGLGVTGWAANAADTSKSVALMSFQGATLYPRLSRKLGQEEEDVLEVKSKSALDNVAKGLKQAQNILGFGKNKSPSSKHADINIFSVASGHLYERMLNIMMVSVMKHTKHSVKFWFIEQFLSPSFKEFIPHLAAEYGFEYEMVTYKWPHWLRGQKEKQREIWGYKILFLDVLFPLSLDKVIFVDADQIVRTDMMELVNHNLNGAPYGFTPMCDSRTEMEGFRFWKQGYWKNFLKGLPYHISALYVVDLKKFRQIAAGDRLRQQYHQLSADPGSLSNLDQDLPNHMQSVLPIHSLPQEWLWCETWCSDESLGVAKTIDLCNNPLTKEPKLDRARRQVPEWTVYDDEIAALDRRRKGLDSDTSASTVKSEARNTKSRKHEEL